MDRTSIKNVEHDEWLEMRRSGIGGSDAAGILGLNPYQSPFAVYCDKLGLTPEINDNEAMRQGRDLEQYVADRFTEATGKKTRRLSNGRNDKERLAETNRARAEAERNTKNAA